MNQNKNGEEIPLISCKWSDCSKKCNNEWDLNGHIKAHLDAVKADWNNRFRCLWGTCEFITQCYTEFQRHLYYHGYYETLLNQGKHECETNPHMPKCNHKSRKGDTIPEIESNYRCGWEDCERSFVSIVEFQDHVVQHVCFDYEISKSPYEDKPKIQCNWNLCKKQPDNKYRLIEHVQTHINKKQVACPNCGTLFRNRATLFDHLRRQPDNNTRQFQCSRCLKFFANKKLLRSHMVKHVYCHKCNLCDMTCSSASALILHIRYRHIKDKPFKCADCDYRCVRKCDLNQHIQLVHRKKMHTCNEPGCTYSSRTNQALRKHFLEMHENTTFAYVCHCCDKPYKNGKSLSAHLKKKHNYKLPSGHKRFTYRIDESGFYRLEMTRIESVEVTEPIQTRSSELEIFEESQSSNYYEIMPVMATDDEVKLITQGNKTPDSVKSTVKVIVSIPNIIIDRN